MRIASNPATSSKALSLRGRCHEQADGVVVRNLLVLRPGTAKTLVARHAVGLPSGEIFVISTEQKANGDYLTTTTLLYYAQIRRTTHRARRTAVIDHSDEIRRLLDAADTLACAAVAG